METIATLSESTLASPMDDSTTTMVVASGATFPPTDTFRVRVDDELFKVTLVSGTTWTVVRATEKTKAAGHLVGAKVRCILTADSLLTLISENSSSGFLTTLAGCPAPSKAGTLAFLTDAPYLKLDTGTSWKAYGPIYNFEPPKLNQFTWFNQQTATAIDRGGVIYMKGCASGSDSATILERPVPLVKPFRVTMACIPHAFQVNYSHCGMCARDSVGGKMTIFSIYNSTNLYSSNWSSATANTTMIYDGPFNFNDGLIFFRYRDNGVNRYWGVSTDGFNFYENVAGLVQPNTSWVTPNRLGFFLDTTNSNPVDVSMMDVYSWKEEYF